MMVKPRGCCDRDGVSPARRTPRSCNAARYAKLGIAAMRAWDKHRYVVSFL